MSDVTANVPIEPNAAKKPKPRTWKRRLVRAFAIYVVVPYVVVAALMVVFQRSLIYHGHATNSLSASLAGRPGNVHDVQVETNDGLMLNGWLLLAEGHTAANDEDLNRELHSGRLLVLYFPGNAGNRMHRTADCRDFTELGANVILVDYRGYADNPGAPGESAFAADAQAVWRHATERLGVPADKIVVYGESLGGGVAVRLAAEHCAAGDPPAGLILSSTFSSLVDAGQSNYPFIPVRYLLWDRFCSSDRAPDITCPVLQIHGARDTIVPFEIGRRLWTFFPEKSASGIEKQFVELPNAGHNDIPQSDFRAAFEPFLKKLGANQVTSSQ